MQIEASFSLARKLTLLAFEHEICVISLNMQLQAAWISSLVVTFVTEESFIQVFSSHVHI